MSLYILAGQILSAVFRTTFARSLVHIVDISVVCTAASIAVIEAQFLPLGDGPVRKECQVRHRGKLRPYRMHGQIRIAGVVSVAANVTHGCLENKYIFNVSANLVKHLTSCVHTVAPTTSF